MKKRHKFLTFTRQYGKYKMVMTQHVFAGKGSKRYGAVNWVIFLNNEHIVLNTYIKETDVKITEFFMDNHWNKFVIDYGENLDVWALADSDIKEYNEYSKKLLNRQVTLDDVDAAMATAASERNNREHTVRQIKKLSKKLKDIYEQIEKLT